VIALTRNPITDHRPFDIASPNVRTWGIPSKHNQFFEISG